MASQIKGLAQLQQNAGTRLIAAKAALANEIHTETSMKE